MLTRDLCVDNLVYFAVLLCIIRAKIYFTGKQRANSLFQFLSGIENAVSQQLPFALSPFFISWSALAKEDALPLAGCRMLWR